MIARVFNGLAAILGAAGAAQFPAFVQQYLQRLGGRLDQIHDDLQRLLADAQSMGRSIEGYLEELMASGTPAAQQAAARELERIDQATRLEQSYYALRDASPLERPMAFVENFDPQIARDTLAVFEPAMPATAEGLAYAGVGMLVGLILLAGSENSGKAVARRVRRRRRRAGTPDPERGRPRFDFQPPEEPDEPVRARPIAPGGDEPARRKRRAEAPERREPSLKFGGGRNA